MDEVFELIDFVRFADNEDEPIPRRYIRNQDNPIELFCSLQFFKRYR